MFGPDSRFQKITSLIEEIVVLNLCFLLACLPVVTIGASVTALYTVLFRIQKKQSGYVARDFFAAFRANFRQATLIWVILAAAGAVLYADLWIVHVLEHPLVPFLRIALLIFVFAWLCIASYVFPMTAYFKNTVFKTLWLSFWFSMGHLPFTISVLVVEVLPLFLACRQPAWQYRVVLPVMLTAGFSLSGMLNTAVFARIFREHEPEREDTEA